MNTQPLLIGFSPPRMTGIPPAVPFGVLRTHKVQENSLAKVLLHSLTQLLEAQHAHLLIDSHGYCALFGAERVHCCWAEPPQGGGIPLPDVLSTLH